MYFDDKIGEVMEVFEGMCQEVIIFFVFDYGDMLGECGFWFKMCFYEGLVCVLLMVLVFLMESGCVDMFVFIIDVCLIFCDLVGVLMDEVMFWIIGESFVYLG